MNNNDTITVWLCEDCATAAMGCEIAWETDAEPLSKIEGDIMLTDDYCSDHYWVDSETPCPNCEGRYSATEDDGYETFSARDCNGCETRLAGTFYRFHAFSRTN